MSERVRSHPVPGPLRCYVLLALLISAHALAAEAPTSLTARVTSRLRPGHPRLMVLDEQVNRIRTLIASDAQVRGLRDEMHAAAERVLDDTPVVHKLVGPRLLSQSRTCLTRVFTLAGMYRLEKDPRFAARAEKELLTAAAFPDWNSKHFLDTAEMTNALAIGYDWLYDVLPESSRLTIRTAIVEKGLEPGLAVYRKGGWWAGARHNWNQVCNGGMLAGALAVGDEEPAIADEVVSHAVKSIPLALATLAPDGGWPEGPGYWCYAMRYTAYFLAAAETGLNTDFGLTDAPGFRDTGLFRIHGIGPSGMVFNFADGGSRVNNAAEMMYFARMFDRPVYAAHQRRFRSTESIFDLLWYDPRGSEEDLHTLPRDALFRGINVAFLRSDWSDPDALFVGFKGGDNAANHSNLDLGTFVLDALGERWAVELGADDYNLPSYFGSKRWTYYRLRTEGQNTLVLGGENQETRARAPMIRFDSSEQRSHAVADLTGAYRPHAGRVRRGIALLDRARVLIQDEIETSGRIEGAWGMHTTARVKISGASAVLSIADKHLHARILEPGDARWTIQEVTLEPPQNRLSNTRKLLIAFNARPPSTRVAVVFWPQRPETPSNLPELQPLESWAGFLQ